MEGYAHGCFICVLSLVVFAIHGEIIPEYLSAVQQGQFMFDRKSGSALSQVCRKPYSRLIRRKRDWLIPPVSIAENDKGPFPKPVVKMKSTAADSMKMTYKITGVGADQPPRNRFIVDKYLGMLSVTESLDREEIKEYVLTTHAEGENYTENPIELIIKIMDQNDNKPRCTQNPFTGEIMERAKQYASVLQVTAEDLDDPVTFNSIVRYKLVKQKPIDGVFQINPTTGVISLTSMGLLDRETLTMYNLEVEAADMDGQGLSSTCMVTIKIIDSNDHAPLFSQKTYASTVQENKAGEVVARLIVTDRDEPFTANSVAKFTIIQGNEDELFNIRTDPSGMEGIITTSKGLDFEQGNNFSLLVEVENEVPFAVPLRTSTATVTITVQDINEPPVFDPSEKTILIYEDLAVGSSFPEYTASDPDTAREQKIRYKLMEDFANWLEITEDTGLVKVKSSLDRDASFIKDGQYKVLVLAYDNDVEPATGTGTLVINLLDVNDNAPVLMHRKVQMCSTKPKPVHLTIIDPDGPENGPPFTVELHKEYQSNWTIIRNSSSVMLTTLRRLAIGEYSLLLRLCDSKLLCQKSSVIAEVCDCEGADVTCSSGIRAASFSILYIFVFAVILCILVLLLLLLKRKCGRELKEFGQKEEDRGNILCYNEEGGGEQDQVFDEMLLWHELEIFSTDFAPTALPTVFYSHHPEDSEDLEDFIYEKLCSAYDDHHMAPCDSLLVFAHEGEGSEAGSLSSIQSSVSDGEQVFQHLHNLGPKFRKLSDIYGGEDEEYMP